LAEALQTAFLTCRDMDAPVNERLAAFAAAIETISPPFAGAVERLIHRLQATHVGRAAPQSGDLFPAFYLPDEQGRVVSLEDVLSEGPAAIVFHRGHWCPYCRINTRALAEALPEVRSAGARLVAILPDRRQFAARLKEESQGDFSVLSDMDNGYAMSLGLAFWVGDEMQRFIAAAGIDIPAYQGNSSWILPVPATFVVGRDAKVRASFIDPDYRKRMAVEEMLAALREAKV
jgi:peroxiredoxin